MWSGRWAGFWVFRLFLGNYEKLLINSHLSLLLLCGGKELNHWNRKIIPRKSNLFQLDTVWWIQERTFLAISNEFNWNFIKSRSKPQRLFYLSVIKIFTMAVVDLDQLKLLEFYLFEKEGPHGGVTMSKGLQVLVKGNFLITNFQASGVFNQGREKTRKLTGLKRWWIWGLGHQLSN